ncbi:hypothetical protein EG329_009340 [Mollisiaceae sp. DMI_Dod_QoI]|nr:hypothetical protein EG329_009340 [Helotiales sp. DMI_Dod_QoI]
MPPKVAKKPVSAAPTRIRLARGAKTDAAQKRDFTPKVEAKPVKTKVVAPKKTSITKMSHPELPVEEPLSPKNKTATKPKVSFKATKPEPLGKTTKNTPKTIEKRIPTYLKRSVTTETVTTTIPAKKGRGRPPATTTTTTTTTTTAKKPSKKGKEPSVDKSLIPGTHGHCVNEMVDQMNEYQQRLHDEHAKLHAEATAACFSGECPGLEPFVPMEPTKLLDHYPTGWENMRMPDFKDLRKEFQEIRVKIAAEEAEVRDKVREMNMEPFPTMPSFPRMLSPRSPRMPSFSRTLLSPKMPSLANKFAFGAGGGPNTCEAERIGSHDPNPWWAAGGIRYQDVGGGLFLSDERLPKLCDCYIYGCVDQSLCEEANHPWRYITKRQFDDCEARALLASQHKSAEGVTCEECKLVIELGLSLPPTFAYVQRCRCKPTWGQARNARNAMDNAKDKKRGKGKSKELSQEASLKKADPKGWRKDFETRVRDAIETLFTATYDKNDSRGWGHGPRFDLYYTDVGAPIANTSTATPAEGPKAGGTVKKTPASAKKTPSK